MLGALFTGSSVALAVTGAVAGGLQSLDSDFFGRTDLLAAAAVWGACCGLGDASLAVAAVGVLSPLPYMAGKVVGVAVRTTD